MKTNLIYIKQTLLKLIPFVLLVLGLSSCNNNKNNRAATVTAPVVGNGTSGYQLINGQCYQVGTNAVVPVSYCPQNTGYQLMNGICVQTQTGQQVPYNYCQYNGAGGAQQSCQGVFWVWNQTAWQQIQCSGANCAGLTVFPNGATSEYQAIRCL